MEKLKKVRTDNIKEGFTFLRQWNLSLNMILCKTIVKRLNNNKEL